MLWNGVNTQVRSINLVVTQGEDAPDAAGTIVNHEPPPLRVVEPQPRPVTNCRTSSRSQLDPRLTFENFVVGKPNEFAHGRRRAGRDLAQAQFNPLFLYGGVGLGKTHLMHAIGHRCRIDPTRKKVVYMTAEKFMYQFVRALRFKEMHRFKELFRSVDLLMVDDVQFISGKDSHAGGVLPHLQRAGRAAEADRDLRRPQRRRDLDGLEERIRSRLRWGLVADLHPTDYELRLGILQAKAEQLADVPQRVMEFLAHRITSNVRELEGALNRMVH